jgi:hypothetical protein
LLVEGRTAALALGWGLNARGPLVLPGALLPLLLAYAAASLFHHVHNAEFLNDYPHMPVWLSPAGVYGAWLGVSAVGVLGYLLIRWQYPLPGLLALGAYGVLGLAGLGHYAVAPMSAHTLAMNLSIWLEVTTALLLLIAVAIYMLRLSRPPLR